MKKTWSLILLGLLPFIGSAQQFQWVQTLPISYTQNPDAIHYVVAADASGQVYLLGHQDGGVPYGTDRMGNLYFNKYAADGQLVFSKTIASHATPYHMEVDSQGNVLMALGWMDTLVFDGLALTSPGQGIQPLLIKTDAEGNLLWHYTPAIPDTSIEQFEGLVCDTDANVYIGYGNYYDSYVMKLSPEGTPLLTIFQHRVHLISSLDVDAAGNIYVAGSCTDPGSVFSDATITDGFDYDTYVAKYDAAGANQWVRFVEDITCAFPEVRAQDPDHVYFGGTLHGAFAFGPLEAEGPGPSSDFFLTRLDADGQFLWMREVLGAGTLVPGLRHFLDVDAAGNAYFAGQLRGTVSWAPGQVTDGPAVWPDLALLRYDPSGDLTYAKLAGGSSYDRADGVAVGPDGAVFLTGIVRENAVFDTFSVNGGAFESIPFVAKLNASLSVQAPIAPLRWYPNPVRETIHFAVPLTGRLVNTLGQTVGRFSAADGPTVSVAHLSPGLYFIEADGFQSGKLLKQ